MTPAITLLKKKRISHSLHQYKHDPQASSYGLEAAEKLQLDPRQVFKTLVVELDNRKLAVAIIPVKAMLNMKRIAKAAGAKKAQMAEPKRVEKSTGYILGGVSPLGQKKRLPTAIDISAEEFPTIYISAGKRGLDIEIQPGDLAMLTEAKFAQLSD